VTAWSVVSNVRVVRKGPHSFVDALLEDALQALDRKGKFHDVVHMDESTDLPPPPVLAVWSIMVGPTRRAEDGIPPRDDNVPNLPE